MLKRSVFAAFCALACVLSLITPASADTVPKDAQAAARELVTAMRLSDQITKMLPTIIDIMKPSIVQGRPEVERDYDQLRGPMLEGFTSVRRSLVDAIAIIYAKHFTVAELRELTAFMRSTTGQKYVAELPAITKESMLMGQNLGQRLGAQIGAKMIDELRKRGHKI